MNPDLTFMLYGAGTAALAFVILVIGYRVIQTRKLPAPGVGEAMEEMKLVDIILGLNLIDAADPLCDLAYENPNAFLRNPTVAGILLNYVEKATITPNNCATEIGDIIYSAAAKPQERYRAITEACAMTLLAKERQNA